MVTSGRLETAVRDVKVESRRRDASPLRRVASILLFRRVSIRAQAARRRTRPSPWELYNLISYYQQSTMKVAIVGSGVSGLGAAWVRLVF